jgi:uncharacterized protein (DUF3084 family)
MAAPMREINQQNSLASQTGTQNHIAHSGNTNEGALLVKVFQLERDLHQKVWELYRGLKEQMFLREQLKACIQSMRESSGQLNDTKNELKNRQRQILERIDELEQENKALQCSNEAWSSRSITLQFEVLAAQGETTTSKAVHELAISKIALLETELKAVKAENDTLKSLITII